MEIYLTNFSAFVLLLFFYEISTVDTNGKARQYKLKII